MIVVLVGAEPALAARKVVRRALPGGQRASASAPAKAAPDPAVQAGVERLLASATAGVPAAQRGGPNDAYLARTSGGYVRALVASPGSPWRVSRPGSDRSPEGLALAFLREHRVALGWSKSGASLGAAVTRRGTGHSTVRFHQLFAGLPVFGAGTVVQVEDSGGVSFVLADIARDDAQLHEAGFSTDPTVAEGAAAATARAVVPSAHQGGLDDGAAAPHGVRALGHRQRRSRAASCGTSGYGTPRGDVNEVVLVDAINGDVAFHYSDVKEAKNRSIYDHNNNPVSTGTLVRSEGGAASGIVDADLAYQYLGDTYDFYFTRFGRDSFDGAGGTLIGRVRYCEATGTCPYPNAYWNGTEMRFGAGYPAADDVVAHELTHAVTERESNLIYWGESGAINESLSDIFGEFVDLTNSGGTDSAWRSVADRRGWPRRRHPQHVGPHALRRPRPPLQPELVHGQRGQPRRSLQLRSRQQARLPAHRRRLVQRPDGDRAGDHERRAALLRGAMSTCSCRRPTTSTSTPCSAWPRRTSAGRPRPATAVERATRAVEIDLATNPTLVFQDGFEGTFPGSWDVIDQGGSTGSGIGTTVGALDLPEGQRRRPAPTARPGAPRPRRRVDPTSPSRTPGWSTGPSHSSNTTNAWADFDLFLDIEYPYDEVFWGLSTDGVNFDGYAISPGPDGFSVGETTVPGWSHEVFNVKEFSGVIGQPQVWLAFQFVSDDIQEYEGAYLDNVVINKSPIQAPFGSFDSPTERDDGHHRGDPGARVGLWTTPRSPRSRSTATR